MALKDIFCQDKAVEILQHAYASGRMAHAYLFSGDDGVGKRTTARAWAKMLLCENKRIISQNPYFADSCGQCHSCRTFEGGGHPDFQMITKELIQFTREGKNKTTPIKMPIDVIREFLIEKIANRPMMGQYVVYVIDEAEKVNRESQNALLKTLEEPPKYCVIILLCSQLDEMLPTTRSRCQLVRFGPVSEERIVQRLCSGGVSKTEAVFWSRFSQGSIGQALVWSQLQIDDDAGLFAVKKELIEKIASLNLPDVLDIADWLSQNTKKIAAAWNSISKNVSISDITRRVEKGLIQMVVFALNDAMKLASGFSSSDLVNEDQLDSIHKLADKYDAETAAKQVEICYRLLNWVDSSVNEKLIYEQLLFNIANSDIMYSL